MLISRRRGRLALVTHPDHAAVAGALCERWGNAGFAVPAPREALLDAAVHHDDGWGELDGQPVFNDSAGRPAHFLEVPLPETVAPYRRGVERIYERDVHAGVLVSMHWSGLYRTRWGLQGGDPVGHPATAEIVEEQERDWAAGMREAWGYRGLRSTFEARTWHAYEVLQALDFLSLALCLLDLESPSAGPPLPMPATLAQLDQSPGPRIVPSVPTGAGGPHVDLTLRVAAPGTVVLDPYPFAAAVSVEVPLRELDDRVYGSAGESAAAFHAARVQALAVTLRAA